MDTPALDMRRDFKDREELVRYLEDQFPAAAARNDAIPETRGGRVAAEALLEKIDPGAYGKTRNYLDGAVTYLSPYIRHGVLGLAEVRDKALQRASAAKAEKLVQELCWRDYWQRVYRVIGDGIWQDLEPWKTGFSPDDYADELPEDIRNAETDLPVINSFIEDLYRTGYLHNRVRMYLAAYVVHWRRVKWQVGAGWFLQHLLDGDPASNNLGWQWVASTFGSKPYIFNQSNMNKYIDGFPEMKRGGGLPQFRGSYDDVAARLFPNGKGSSGAPDNDYKNRLKKVVLHPPTGQPDLQFENPIVWVHGDNLNPSSAAYLNYPDAPSVWVWDDDLLADYNIALKRIVFMYESLLETPASIRRGNVYTEVVGFAYEHGADGIVVMDSPSPRFRGLVKALEKDLPVKILAEEPIVPYDGPYDLRRFMRYWKSAQQYAFGEA